MELTELLEGVSVELIEEGVIVVEVFGVEEDVSKGA